MRNKKNQRIIVWVVFACYILVLLRLTVFRSDFMQFSLFTHGTLNLVPFGVYLRILGKHRYLYAIYQFGGNIAWFIPFGFLLPYQTGRPQKLKMMLLFGLLFSVVIEFSQFAFGTGESELDDLILNTIGAIIGFQLFRLTTHVKAKKK